MNNKKWGKEREKEIKIVVKQCCHLKEQEKKTKDFDSNWNRDTNEMKWMTKKRKNEMKYVWKQRINITKLHELYKFNAFHIIEMNPFTKYDENIQNQNPVHYTPLKGMRL